MTVLINVAAVLGTRLMPEKEKDRESLII